MLQDDGAVFLRKVDHLEIGSAGPSRIVNLLSHCKTLAETGQKRPHSIRVGLIAK